MSLKKIASVSLVALVLGVVAMPPEPAEARAGRSRSGGVHRSWGDRGSRTFDNHSQFRGMEQTRRSATQRSPFGAPAAPAAAGAAAAAANRGSFFQRHPILTGLGAGLAGSMIGNMLFGHHGGMGGAGGFGGGGFGFGDFLTLLLLGGIGFWAYKKFVANKKKGEVAYAGYSSRGSWRDPAKDNAPLAFGGSHAGGALLDAPAPKQSTESGLAGIMLNTPNLTREKLVDQLSAVFFGVQEAWSANDTAALKPLLTEEMQDYFGEEIRQYVANGERNVLKNISIRSFDILEAWQDGPQEFVTAKIQARLLDYVEKDGRVIEGSATDATEFHEVWTFERPRGGSTWRLSAQNQVA